MTEQEAIGLLDEMRAAYPASNLSTEGLRLYVRDLRNLRFDVAREAVRSAIHACRFLPTLAELHEHYGIAAEQHRRKLEEERIRLERLAEDNMPRPELQEIPAAREYLAKLMAGDRSEELNLERVADGKCFDCGKEGQRFKLGPNGFCSRCVAPRLRARVEAA